MVVVGIALLTWSQFRATGEARSWVFGTYRTLGIVKDLQIAVRDVETGTPGNDAEYNLPEKAGHDEYSYPSIKQGPEGNLHMSYTFRRATIKYVTFSEQWIRDGGTLGQFKGDPQSAASKKN